MKIIPPLDQTIKEISFENNSIISAYTLTLDAESIIEIMVGNTQKHHYNVKNMVYKHYFAFETRNFEHWNRECNRKLKLNIFKASLHISQDFLMFPVFRLLK